MFVIWPCAPKTLLSITHEQLQEQKEKQAKPKQVCLLAKSTAAPLDTRFRLSTPTNSTCCPFSALLLPHVGDTLMHSTVLTSYR